TGYVPSALGRSLRRGGTSQIAVVAPDAQNPYFTQIIGEVERIARGQNHSVTVAHTEDDLALEQECFAQLVSRRVSGVLLVPVVRGIDGAPTDVVATDNREAGRQAARHLHERGFRSPTVIAGPPALRTTEDRATGFLSVWRELGVEVGADALRRGDLHLGSG